MNRERGKYGPAESKPITTFERGAEVLVFPGGQPHNRIPFSATILEIIEGGNVIVKSEDIKKSLGRGTSAIPREGNYVTLRGARINTELIITQSAAKRAAATFQKSEPLF